jgi:hypothetical protein
MMTGRGESQALSEYQIKAAFLYNFAKFIDWPPTAFPDPSTPVVLCVLGQDPFGPDLEQTITGKTVNNRPFAIQRFAKLQDRESCHILFISSSERDHLSQILASLKDKKTLTVGETPTFLSSGGMINFTLLDNRIRFEINLSAAERAGLKLSSKLLSLATTVKTEG